ncbi:MAG: ABC transporter permease [Spirochaetales bacterium]|uniref:Oligopeptide transport system permease protein OppC n=1 Tax=Candidatus Thalassospirochaeta sargassi TaxID=3119039 RepID=A0AAJ1IBP0_9SPIO|nr:ABC transporter permease [Spirochaetales bacterium]
MDAWRRLRKNKMAMGGLVVMIIYAVISLSAGLLPIYSYKQQVLEHQYLPPSTRPAGELLIEKKVELLSAFAAKEGRELNAVELEEIEELKERIATETKVLLTGEEVKVHERVYYLGTDELGRDLLARIIYGGQVSIMIGLIGALASMIIGVVLGALSGYIGGAFDSLLMRFVDIMYSLPYMLLVIIMMSMFGKNIMNLFFALAIVSWLTVCRVVRGQIISLKNAEFVEAARASGAGTWRIVLRHLIPNTMSVIVVYTTLRVPSFIMLEAFLSFLGLGVQAPYASWGVLIHDGVYAMTTYPWMLWFPAIVMTLFLFSMNFFGDGLRDALDPQSKNKL